MALTLKLWKEHWAEREGLGFNVNVSMWMSIQNLSCKEQTLNETTSPSGVGQGFSPSI